jgi:hypothetical protein
VVGRRRLVAAPKGGTRGYCQARMRLSSDFLDRIDARITRSLCGATRPDDLWHGLIVKAFDGTSVQLDDTPANQKISAPTGETLGNEQVALRPFQGFLAF